MSRPSDSQPGPYTPSNYLAVDVPYALPGTPFKGQDSAAFRQVFVGSLNPTGSLAAICEC